MEWLRNQRKDRAPRFAVLRWVVRVAYFDTEKEARRAARQVPVDRRAGLVDRETGYTWCREGDYEQVKHTLRREEFTAGRRFRRIGRLKVGPPTAKR